MKRLSVHWIQTNLTEDEIALLIHAARINTSIEFDVPLMPYHKLSNLISKLMQLETSLNEEGKTTNQQLISKLNEALNT